MKIAILDDYQKVARDFADWSRLPGDARVSFFHDTLRDREALVARLAPFEIIGAMRERTPFPRALIERLPNLRLLVTSGARNASIDLRAAKDHGVVVCGTGSPGHATAELAFGLILALARDLPGETRSIRTGGWQLGIGRDLNGATLGVIGLGRLGGRVAGMGRAFGMRVLAWSQNLTAERAADQGAERVSKEELLRRSDFVTVHMKLGDRSRGLIGAAELALMRPDAFLINTSRAPIVDTAALVAALTERRIAGAALDVFDEEPLPPDDALPRPLRQVERLLLTPHIGYVTRQTYDVFYGETLEAILAFLAGTPIRVMEPS